MLATTGCLTDREAICTIAFALKSRTCHVAFHFPCNYRGLGDKDQGGPFMNSGPVAITSGVPAVMIDSTAVR
jgi:hypothetical protein